ncbi:MAG: YihY/virulence factor BrkB family protein [Clostridia bacterium]|nr:YihY/virulence factor BrkB family protein [Clostridia bacterium]
MRKGKHTSVWDVRHLIRVLKEIAAVFRRDMVPVYAAQASFFLLLASVPFLVLMLNIGKIFFRSVSDDVLSLLENILPAALHGTVGALGEQIAAGGGIPLLSVSAATAFWSASRGMAALERGLAGVYGVNVSRGLFRDILRSLTYTVTLILLIFVTLILLVFGAQLADGIMSVLPSLEGPITAVLEARGVFVFLTLTAFFTLVHRVIVKDAPILPGAALSAAGWMLFSYLYSLYVQIFPRASYLYGSLALFTVLMLWLYFCMIIFLTGAEVNKWIGHTRV